MIRHPVIIIGPPRSGTTVLFRTLARSSRLWSLDGESHDVFEGPYHPRLRGWESNVLGASDLDPGIATRLRSAFERHARPGFLRRLRWDRPVPLRFRYAVARARMRVHRHLGRPIRLLEKTPKNCLRLPFLRALFPDAKFVVLRRDGRATISSLIDAWRIGGPYETYRLPEPLHIQGCPGQGWCFVLAPGWRRLTHASLEEVCAAQWSACVKGIIATLPALRAAGAVHELAYEDLIDRPREVLSPLLAFLGLPFERAIEQVADSLPIVNVVTVPEREKWRRRNGEAIARVMPRIAVLQRALGYDR